MSFLNPILADGIDPSETRENQGRILVEMSDSLVRFLRGADAMVVDLDGKAYSPEGAALVTALILSERIRNYVEGAGDDGESS